MSLSNQISIIYSNEIYSLDLNVVLERLSTHVNTPIHSIIRIKKEEFEQINFEEVSFTHFNLEQSGHIPGKIYLLLKIVQQGYADGDKEVLPILDLENSQLYKCVECKEKITYSSLKIDDFKYSMNHIKNANKLFKAIWRRYSISRPHLSQNEMYTKGVSITTLNKIKSQKKIDKELVKKIVEEYSNK